MCSTKASCCYWKDQNICLDNIHFFVGWMSLDNNIKFLVSALIILLPLANFIGSNLVTQFIRIQ